MSTFTEEEQIALEQQQQQQQQMDFYGQAGHQQTNIAAGQYADLANNPELAQILQQEAQSQAMGLPYMMGPPMIGLGGPMYRMPQDMMAMPQMGAIVEDEPLYVNAKQYNRILKRRQARAKIDAILRQQKAAGDKPAYMHESRHRHAMKRPRGPGGRFLTASEIAALKSQEVGKESSDSSEKAETDSSSSNSVAEPNKKEKPTKV